MNSQNVNQIKKRVISRNTAAQSSRDPASLVLGEHDGILWASNRYWITPAARVAPLLEQYNLSADQPGSFEVNTTVRKVDDRGFQPGRLLGKPEEYPDPASPVLIGGHRAHVRLSDRHPWLAAYQSEDGAAFGLPADDLAWLMDITGMQLSRLQAFERGPDDHFGEARVMCKGRCGMAAVAITVDVTRTVTPASYGTAADGGSEYHPAETQNLGPRVIGLLMPVKLDG
jgi:hypothetical protein